MMCIVYDGTSLSNGVFQRLSLVWGKIFRLFKAGPGLYAGWEYKPDFISQIGLSVNTL